MKTLVLSLTLMALSSANAAAQQDALLWKIEREDLSQPSYLYGTIHLICREDMVEVPEVAEALAEVDRLVFELDFSDPQLPRDMMMASRADDGSYLQTYLDDQEQEVVETFFKSRLGMEPAQVQGLKPFALTGMAMQTLIECVDGPYSFEGSLMARSSEHGIAVSGLETPAFQFGLFENIPTDEQLDNLVDGLMKPDSVRQVFRSLVDEYRDQDIESLHRVFSESSTAEYQKQILDDRNEAWIPKIEGVMKSGSAFIAVGAMHLGGERGVIELLREQGYSVRPAGSD